MSSALGIVQKYHPNVTKVVDAKKNIDISVTAADCKVGRSKKPSACAMAKACMRDYDGAIISMARAYLVKGDKAIRYNVPQAVSREIVSFDRSRKFSPGIYSLKHIQKNERLGQKAWGTRGTKTGKDIGNRVHHKTAGIRAL